MFPAVLMIIPLFILMREMRLLDTNLGLALAYTSFAAAVRVDLERLLRCRAPDLEDAARIDGCTRLGAQRG